ncbi:hypothetical protein [Sphingomonas sp. BE137]|uniref:hypothetical protein n=1 Tax=Sphingomonas sp. BE137 TaxID=2817844 RepID=UPI00286A330A|nr:hypothetical protein [Sphingomonas sp. BE137]
MARPSGGPFAFQRNRKDPSEIAAHIDLQLVVFRRQSDLPHQRADHVGGDHPLLLRIFLKRGIQFVDLDVVMMRHVGMQEGWRLFGVLKERLQLLLSTLQHDHLLVETIGGASLQNEVQKRVEFAVNPLDLGFGRVDRRPAFHAEPVHLAGEFLAELLEQRGVH